jgi:superfamily II DNA/RNA helicase
MASSELPPNPPWPHVAICPNGGTVCTLCGARILHDDVKKFKREWKRHRDDFHPDMTSLKPNERLVVYNAAMLAMRSLATQFAAMSDDERAVALYKYLSKPAMFAKCNECNKLIHCTENHDSRRHDEQITAKIHRGCRPLLWSKTCMLVIPYPVDARDTSIFDKLFLTMMRAAEASIVQNPTAPPQALPLVLVAANDVATAASQRAPTHSTTNVTANIGTDAAANTTAADNAAADPFLASAWKNQNDVLSAATDDTIHVFGQDEETNVWLERAGWAVHLKGYSRGTVYSWTLPKGDGESLSRILESVNRVLDWAAAESIALSKSNNILVVLQSRADGIYGDSHFRASVKPKTVELYKSTMTKIVRVVFRMEAAGPNERLSYDMQSGMRNTMDRLRRITSRPVVTASDIARLDEYTTNFLMALYRQKMGADTYDWVLASALAVLSLNKDGSFMGANEYTPTYAATIISIKWLILATCKRESLADGAVDFMDRVEIKMDEFMKSPKYPIDWIYRTLAYGRAVGRETGPENHVVWSRDKQTITYGTITISMDDLRSVVHALLQQTRSDLWRLFLFDPDSYTERPPIPAIPWQQTHDDNANKTATYSFLTDPRNAWIEQKASFIWDRLCSDPVLQQKWLRRVDGKFVGFLPKAHEEYKKLVDTFRERFLVLEHLTGGQTGRQPEVINVRYTNSASGAFRNVLLYDGSVCFSTGYNKSLSQTKCDKLVHRMVPHEVGELLVYHLTMVVPFWRFIHSKGTGDAIESGYLWCNNVTLPTLGESDFWHPGRLSKAMTSAFRHELGVSMNVRSYRQISAAICKEHVRPLPTAPNRSDVYAAQCAHSALVDDIKYAQEKEQMRFGSSFKRHEFREASERWHAFLGFTPRSAPAKHTVAVISKNFASLRRERLAQLSSMTDEDLVQALQEMHDNLGASFRGNQLEVLRFIYWQPTKMLLQIAPTGCGKSLSFMLPAFTSPNGTTIVIVPLVSLKYDLEKRCEDAGIATISWNANIATHPTAAIVLVTAESFVGSRFQTFVRALTDRSRLDRIVVDECHSFLDCDDTFRPKMQKVGKLVTKWKVQAIFLTATLPPSNVQNLLDWTGLTPSKLKIFRGKTTRPNLKYSLIVDLDKPQLDLAVSEVNRLLTEYNNEGRYIVYVRRLIDGERLAELLYCPFFHSECDSKSEMFDEWRINGSVIVATNALGAGIDVPDIRGVVHVGMSPNLRSYAQESGRAGRDGDVSTCVVLPGNDYPLDTTAQDYVKAKNRCRRGHLDSHMDGTTGRKSCDGSLEQLCDICSNAARTQGMSDGANIELESTHDESSDEMSLSECGGDCVPEMNDGIATESDKQNDEISANATQSTENESTEELLKASEELGPEFFDDFELPEPTKLAAAASMPAPKKQRLNPNTFTHQKSVPVYCKPVTTTAGATSPFASSTTRETASIYKATSTAIALAHCRTATIPAPPKRALANVTNEQQALGLVASA